MNSDPIKGLARREGPHSLHTDAELGTLPTETAQGGVGVLNLAEQEDSPSSNLVGWQMSKLRGKGETSKVPSSVFVTGEGLPTTLSRTYTTLTCTCTHTHNSLSSFSPPSHVHAITLHYTQIRKAVGHSILTQHSCWSWKDAGLWHQQTSLPP